MNTITIPPLVYKKYPPQYTETGRPKAFEIEIIGSCNDSWLRFQDTTIYLYNQNDYIINANTCQTIAFPVTVITSLPALCLLTCNSFIYNKGLSYMINTLPSNDSYLYVSLFNYTSRPIVLYSNELQVTCKVVLTGKPYNIQTI